MEVGLGSCPAGVPHKHRSTVQPQTNNLEKDMEVPTDIRVILMALVKADDQIPLANMCNGKECTRKNTSD